MADYTQASASLLDHQEITHPANVIGSAVDVSSALAGVVMIWLANIETTANATGVNIKLQGSPDAAGNDWVTIRELVGSTTASESEALSDAGGEPQGEVTLAVENTTNLTVGDLVYIKAASGISESEWAEIVKVVTNTSIDIADGLAAAKAQNDMVYDQASIWQVYVDLSGYLRLRVQVVHQAATGSDIRVKAEVTYATDIE